jgi:hypothetical protein
MLAGLGEFKDPARDERPRLVTLFWVGVIMIIAADRRQARVIMRYCTGLLKAVPMLAKLICAETREPVCQASGQNNDATLSSPMI